MVSQYLFVFAQAHDEFRIPELLSVAELHKIRITFSEEDLSKLDVSRPFMVLELENEDDARTLAKRCILIKHVLSNHPYLLSLTFYCRLIRSVHEFYARGTTYEEVHQQTQDNFALWSHHILDTSFKFKVEAYNHSIPQRRQKEIVESFGFMALLGKIEMKNPDIIFSCFEECAISLNGSLLRRLTY